MKKFLSALLCIVLAFSMLSFNALAINDDTEVSVGGLFDSFTTFIGNSIRSESQECKQGLRFKYSVDFTAYEFYENQGYTVEEIGVLAICSSYLNGKELVKNGIYNSNKVNKGVFYSTSKGINKFYEDNTASAVLTNIGYDTKTNSLDFSAYADSYTTRMYTVLTKDNEQITLYDDEETACVVDVMKAINDKYNADKPSSTSQLYADYQSVQTVLKSTVTDKKGKTVKQIYEGKYPPPPPADEDKEEWTDDNIIDTRPR